HAVTLRGAESDSMIASYLLDASQHDLGHLVLEHVRYKALSEEDICGKGVKALSLADLPPEAVVDYAGERADLAGQLAPILDERLAALELKTLYETLELPLVPVLVDIERAGVRIDSHALAGQSQRIEQQLSTLQRQIFDMAGGEFNVNSPK